MGFTTSINTSLLTTYLIKKFIPLLTKDLQFQKFTQKASVPPGMGVTARWNKFSELTGNTTALTEGAFIGQSTTGVADGAITTMTSTGVEATIAEYGQYIDSTSLQEYAAVKGSRDELVKNLSYSASLTLDTLVRLGQGGSNGANATTTAFYAGTAQDGGGTTAATPTACSAAALMGCRKVLRGNSARGLSGISGHPDGHFAAIISPQAELDLTTENTTGRITWSNSVVNVPGKMGQDKFVNGYVGSVYGVAVYCTQNFSNATVTSGSDVNYVLADNGLGALSIKDAKPTIFINTASATDTSNPYRNHNTIAWHSFFATRLLDSNRVVKLYTLT